MAIQTILGDLKKDVAAIYVAVFGRAPEKAGLEFWLEQQSKYNWDLSQLADAMIQAAKAYPGYENIDDPQVLVTNLYENVLGKTYQDDPDGINYWVEKIKEGYDPGYVVEQILETAVEKYPDHPATKTFLNRVDVALETAENIETADLNGDGKVEAEELKVFQKIIKQVTDDPNTVKQAEQLIQQIKEGNIPGDTFKLTNAADEIKGTMFNDVIEGVVSSLTSENTLNPNDKIDGGDGTDTINLDVKGSFNGFSNDGYMKNVEIVNLVNDSTIPRTFSAKGIEGAKKFNIDAKQAAINLSDMQLGAEVDLKNQKSGTFTISYDKNAVAGTNDEQLVTLENVGTPDNPDTTANEESSVKISLNGIENVKLNAAAGDNIVNIDSDVAKNVVVEGKGNIKITQLPNNVKTFDASEAEGKVNVDFSSNSNISGVTTIKGGKGNDTITINLSNVLGNATIEGGDGQDTLTIKGSGTVQFNQSGIETVKFDTTNGNITYSALNASDIQKFVFTNNVANNITVANLGAKDYTVELDGSNTSGATISVDNSGTLNIDVAKPAANATATSPTSNNLGVTAQKAVAVDLTVEPKMAYNGVLNLPTATYLNVKSDGNITLGAGSNLAQVQELSVEANGNVNLGAANLPKAGKITLSGNGQATLGNIGGSSLDYDVNITAQGLPNGLTLGTIDTKTNVNVDVSNVSGNVSIGNIGATQAPVNVTIDASNTLGTVTLGNITATNITVNAQNAIQGVTYGTFTLNESGSLDLTGSQLKGNTLTVTLTGSKDETVKIVGGIDNDSITINAGTFSGKAKLDIKGDLGNDSVTFNNSLDVTKGLTLDGVENLTVAAGQTLTANASDISGKTLTINKNGAGASAAKGEVYLKATDSNDIIDLSNISGTALIGIEPGKGADTIKLGGAKEEINLTAPFENADKIEDFNANASDTILLDLAKNNSDKFGTLNQIPSKAATAAGNKASVVIPNAAGTKLAIVTKAINATIGAAATIGGIFVGKSYKVSNNTAAAGVDKLIIKTKAGTNIISKAASANKTGILFFYDTDDKKLQVLELHWGATNGTNKITGGISVKTVKTIATLSVTNVAKLDKADILIY